MKVAFKLLICAALALVSRIPQANVVSAFSTDAHEEIYRAALPFLRESVLSQLINESCLDNGVHFNRDSLTNFCPLPPNLVYPRQNENLFVRSTWLNVSLNATQSRAKNGVRVQT